jgi:hypothetical protein
MEAASWLAGEPWSDHPKAVHRRIAAIARATNDALDDERRQSLWPLVLRSVGTGKRRSNWSFRRHLSLDRRLRSVIRHARVATTDGEALRSLWETLLGEFDDLYAERPTAAEKKVSEKGDSLSSASSPAEIAGGTGRFRSAGRRPASDDQ